MIQQMGNSFQVVHSHMHMKAGLCLFGCDDAITLSDFGTPGFAFDTHKKPSTR
jgi:hypothetical protein